MTRRLLLALTAIFGLSLCLPAPALDAARRARLPSRLSDREFWQLAADSSEPNGYFRSDNLTSNELGFQKVIPELVSRTAPGGVYLGVGPEQNFTYIVALRPALAVIFDIRRGNMLVQLMYKALFELAKDRADFVSMLFSRARPASIGAQTSVQDVFAAYAASTPDEALYMRNVESIERLLTKTHELPLAPEDLRGLEHAYRTFYARGAAVRFSPTYSDLMVQTDGAGTERSYLASEANFVVMKDLEARNLVVPVVGDFAGPKAIRSVAAYLKGHGATVTAFYLSNVEQYLDQDGKWAAFCRNVATLPLDGSSTFIRTTAGRGVGFGMGFVSTLGSMAAETRNCGQF